MVVLVCSSDTSNLSYCEYKKMSPFRGPLFFLLVVPVWDHELDRLACVDVGDADAWVLVSRAIAKLIDVIVVASFFAEHFVDGVACFDGIFDRLDRFLSGIIQAQESSNNNENHDDCFYVFHTNHCPFTVIIYNPKLK